MYKAAWEYSDRRPYLLFDTTPMSTVHSAEIIYEMAQAIGKPFAVGMYLISPFICPPEGLDVIAYRKSRQENCQEANCKSRYRALLIFPGRPKK